jgi:hypothetical protein
VVGFLRISKYPTLPTYTPSSSTNRRNSKSSNLECLTIVEVRVMCKEYRVPEIMACLARLLYFEGITQQKASQKKKKFFLVITSGHHRKI